MERIMSGPAGQKKHVFLPNKRVHIAVAEDDGDFRRLLAMMLKRASFEVSECSDGSALFSATAGSILDRSKPAIDLIISDVRMPGYTGLEFLEKLGQLCWKIPVILITAFGEEKVHNQAKEMGALAVFDKPFEIDELVRFVERVTGRSS
jgi:two-component system response regulator (stage 0 sporulation protein F)